MKRTARAILLSCVVSLAVAGAAAAADDLPPNMEQLFMVLLKKGPKWSAEESKEREAIQAGHMANIVALWKAQKLVIAGPMGDDGDIRGIFIFRVPTQEDAQRLVDSDPAVKAGRLVGEIHGWWVEKGTLPAAGSYCDGTKPKP